MAKQRDIMRQLWRKYAPDHARIIREYAVSEMAGLVPRASNPRNTSPIEYAKRLLADGLAKGWLDATTARRTHVRHEPPVVAHGISVPATNAQKSLSSPDIGREEWAALASQGLGVQAEDPHYLQLITDWRNAWHPQRVRLLLVAESHVAEQPGDSQVYVELPASIQPSAQLPAGFCRLVYCLGYGESEICRPRAPVANGGTWQFWDLFGAIAARYEPSIAPQMPRRGLSNLHSRLQWKIAVLEVLRRAGVWLEDASIIAIYATGGGRRASGRAYARTVRESFERFVWTGVASDRPEQVWAIGRGIGGALRGLPMIQESRVISQPQDRDAERYARDMARLLQSLPDGS